MLKLLIVKTSSLGDAIHNLPIINDILRHYPDVEIGWVVEEGFADIPKLHPAVKHVIPVAIRRWRRAIFNKQTWAEVKAAKQQLQAKQYDIVLDTQGLLKSAFISNLASGAKHGYDKNSIREPLASYFYQTKHQISRNLHAVERNRTLAALALDYPIPTDLPDFGIKTKGIKSSAIPTGMPPHQPYVIGLHGTSRDGKLWPTGHWIALGHELAKQDLHLALPWASDVEFQRARLIASTLSNATVLPKSSITQLVSIIGQAQAAVGVDTGLSHLSGALGVPTIVIYTDSNPALSGVYAPAINLGNIGETPTVGDVTKALQQIIKK